MKWSGICAAAALCGASLATVAEAQAPASVAPIPPRFAPPERLTEGDTFVGQGRIYPSPVMFDIDGNGRAELILGDLRGDLTITRRTTSGSSTVWEGTEPLRGAGGTNVKFTNW